MFTELAHAFPAFQVAAAPDAGADPDGGDADNHDDDADDPAPVVGDPARGERRRKISIRRWKSRERRSA